MLQSSRELRWQALSQSVVIYFNCVSSSTEVVWGNKRCSDRSFPFLKLIFYNRSLSMCVPPYWHVVDERKYVSERHIANQAEPRVIFRRRVSVRGPLWALGDLRMLTDSEIWDCIMSASQQAKESGRTGLSLLLRSTGIINNVTPRCDFHLRSHHTFVSLIFT